MDDGPVDKAVFTFAYAHCFHIQSEETLTNVYPAIDAITSFSKTTEGAVSHNVLYSRPLPNTRYLVRLMLIIIFSNYQ